MDDRSSGNSEKAYVITHSGINQCRILAFQRPFYTGMRDASEIAHSIFQLRIIFNEFALDISANILQEDSLNISGTQT